MSAPFSDAIQSAGDSGYVKIKLWQNTYGDTAW